MLQPSQHERSENTYVSIKCVYAPEDVAYTCYFSLFLTTYSSLFVITVLTLNPHSYMLMTCTHIFVEFTASSELLITAALKYTVCTMKLYKPAMYQENINAHYFS